MIDLKERENLTFVCKRINSSFLRIAINKCHRALLDPYKLTGPHTLELTKRKGTEF